MLYTIKNSGNWCQRQQWGAKQLTVSNWYVHIKRVTFTNWQRFFIKTIITIVIKTISTIPTVLLKVEIADRLKVNFNTFINVKRMRGCSIYECTSFCLLIIITWKIGIQKLHKPTTLLRFLFHRQRKSVQFKDYVTMTRHGDVIWDPLRYDLTCRTARSQRNVQNLLSYCFWTRACSQNSECLILLFLGTPAEFLLWCCSHCFPTPHDVSSNHSQSPGPAPWPRNLLWSLEK